MKKIASSNIIDSVILLFFFPKRIWYSISISFDTLVQSTEYQSFSLPQRKSPAPIAELSIFHFLSASDSLHLASGMLGEPSKTMQSTALPGSTLCFKRLTDTRVACRLDWQGLIVFNIPHLPRAVKFHFLTYPVHSSSRYLKLSVKNRL